MWRQTKVAIKLLAHPADVFVDGSGEPHGFLDDHDRHGGLDMPNLGSAANACAEHASLYQSQESLRVAKEVLGRGAAVLTV